MYIQAKEIVSDEPGADDLRIVYLGIRPLNLPYEPLQKLSLIAIMIMAVAQRPALVCLQSIINLAHA